jgi:hypothetical protein
MATSALRTPRRRDPRRRTERGQAMTEFAIAVIPFLMVLMGIVDLGRGIYQMNTTAEAAREIARATSVHPWAVCNGSACDLGSSAEGQAVVATQRNLLPGMVFTPSTDIVCVDLSDTVKADRECDPGDFVRVRIRSMFTPVTPIVAMFGSHTFESYARIQMP